MTSEHIGYANQVHREAKMQPNTTNYEDFLTNGLFITANYSLDEYLKITTEYTSSNHQFSQIVECAFITLFCVIILFGILGNAVIVCVVFRTTALKSTRNWFVLNLAISDILTCIFCLPFEVVRLLLKNWPLGEMLCKLAPSLQALYIFVSTLTIVAIATDRYKAIVNCSVRTPDKSKLLYIFPMLWMVSLALALPMFVFHRVKKVEAVPGIVLFSVCMEKWTSYISRGCYTTAVLIFHFVLPLIAIAILHILICRYISVRIGIRHHFSVYTSRNRRHFARQRKNIILLTCVAVSFALTWLPLTLVNLIADFNHNMFSKANFYLLNTICHAIAMTSVCINPIVYGWYNSNFRREIQVLLCRVVHHKDNNDGVTTTERKSSRIQNRVDLTLYSYMPAKQENH